MTTDITLPKGKVGPTGLTLPDQLIFDQWVEIGRHLIHAHQFGQQYLSAVRWALADWIIYGERKYGEVYAQAIEETGLSYQRLTNLVWVGRKFDASRRRENLYIEHHATVAKLAPDGQDLWLDAAERQGWSARRLYEELQRAQDAMLGAAPGESTAIRLLDRAMRGVAVLDPDAWAHYVIGSLVEPLGKLDVDPARYGAFLRALRDRIDDLLKGETE